MRPERLREIRERVDATRGSLSTRATLQEVMVSVETLKAHANLDLPELLDAYDALLDQAAALWEQANPHTESCPASTAPTREHACNCARATMKNPHRMG